MTKYLEFRNISTILNSILLTIFGLISGYLASQGLNLPIDSEVCASLVGGIILLAFSYLNAKNKNTLFDQDTDTIYLEVDGLTEEQVAEINQYIEKILNQDNNVYADDPATAYEDEM